MVSAARELFIGQGYESTTIAQVARTAGVSVPTVQKVFGTKAALRQTIAAESRIGARELVDKLIAVGGLRPGLDRDDAIDALWWLIQPEQYVVLVGHAGWPLERFVAWFNTTAARLLLADPV